MFVLAKSGPPLTDGNGQCACCSQGRAGCPHRENAGVDTQGQWSLLPLMACPEVALTVVPLVWAFIHSFIPPVIHSLGNVF